MDNRVQAWYPFMKRWGDGKIKDFINNLYTSAINEFILCAFQSAEYQVM